MLSIKSIKLPSIHVNFLLLCSCQVPSHSEDFIIIYVSLMSHVGGKTPISDHRVEIRGLGGGLQRNIYWPFGPQSGLKKRQRGGGGPSPKNFFRFFGPPFDLKIRARARPLDPPLKTANHHREGIYTSFEFISPVLAEVVVQF